MKNNFEKKDLSNIFLDISSRERKEWVSLDGYISFRDSLRNAYIPDEEKLKKLYELLKPIEKIILEDSDKLTKDREDLINTLAELNMEVSMDNNKIKNSQIEQEFHTGDLVETLIPGEEWYRSVVGKVIIEKGKKPKYFLELDAFNKRLPKDYYCQTELKLVKTAEEMKEVNGGSIVKPKLSLDDLVESTTFSGPWYRSTIGKIVMRRGLNPEYHLDIDPFNPDAPEPWYHSYNLKLIKTAKEMREMRIERAKL